MSYKMWSHYCTVEKTEMMVGKGEECNWCGQKEGDSHGRQGQRQGQEKGREQASLGPEVK